MTRKTIACLFFVACIAGLTQGCGSGGQPPTGHGSSAEQFANWPSALDNFRFHWTSDPEVPLTTGFAVPIRAYFESWYIASWTNNAEAVYPGFLRATPESDDLDGGYLGQLAWIRPLNGRPGYPTEPVTPYGFMPVHIQSVEPIDNGLRVTVCEGQYAAFLPSESAPNQMISLAANKQTGELSDPLDTVLVNRIELTQNHPRIPAGASDVDTPQEGPAPAPVGDVFGHWFITGASSSLWGPVDAKPHPDFFVTPDMRRQCQEAMPDSPETQIEMATGFKDNPPPHGQPIPGWPLAPQ